jgi:hypothetical protein
MLRRFLPALIICTGAFAAAGAIGTPAAPPTVAATQVSVLTASEVVQNLDDFVQNLDDFVQNLDDFVQILDQTSDWHRALGMLQQDASQPSDVLILYANRQIAGVLNS